MYKVIYLSYLLLGTYLPPPRGEHERNSQIRWSPKMKLLGIIWVE